MTNTTNENTRTSPASDGADEANETTCDGCGEPHEYCECHFDILDCSLFE